jgi:hypothetical protein
VNLNTFSAISDMASCLNSDGGAAYFIPILSSSLRTSSSFTAKLMFSGSRPVARYV